MICVVFDRDRFDIRALFYKIRGVKTLHTQTDIATPAELASDYKTTKPTILAWFHQKRIPAVVSIGRVIRFSRAEVAQALASRDSRKGDAA